MRWGFVWAFCLLQLFLGTPSVLAQNADASRSASARALFDEGVKFADSAQWSEAADRFQRALALRDSQVIRFNLANALAELGRLVEATELLRQVERDGTVDAAVKTDASTRLNALTPKLARLTVQTEGDANGVNVFLDGAELSAVQLGVAMPVDPVTHALRAVRAGEEVDAQSVTLAEGGAQTVTLKTVRVATPAEAAATLVPVAAPSPVPVDTDDHDQKRRRRLWWGIGGAAVAVAAIVVVSALVAGNSGGGTASPYHGDFNPPSVPVQVQ